MDRMKVERIIMGPENKIEFTGGSLYFGDHAVDVKSFEVSDFESVIDARDYTDSIIKIITEPMEITCTCEVKFRGLVKLLGFWRKPAFFDFDNFYHRNFDSCAMPSLQ